MKLSHLLAPRSVALVGASARSGSVGQAIARNILKARFKGEFGIVNPRHREIAGTANEEWRVVLPTADNMTKVIHEIMNDKIFLDTSGVLQTVEGEIDNVGELDEDV